MNSGTEIELARSLCRDLKQAFGFSFDIWVQIEKVWRWSRDDESSGEHLADERSIGDALQQTEIGIQPHVARIADGRTLLVVPVRNGRRALLAAVGFIEHEDTKLVLRLANALLVALDRQRELLTAHAKVEEYTFQVTSDFEELVWLRNLGELIEICDVRNDVANVAQSTLPTLRVLIQAEAMFLFGMPSVEERAHGAAVGPMRFHDGDDHVPESRARELIEHLQVAAIGQPVVRNARRGEFVSSIEGIRNCILIRLIRSGFQSGWLLVLNKNRTIEDEFSAPIAASALSHWEFGTFEAGLVNAAAIMLSTHSRNVELLREKETLLVGVIRALINAIDAKDAYTFGHSDRVALMAKRMAQHLGLSDAECERIYMAGMLHDIGKIGIPDRVLGKPDKLTDEEFAIIKTHPDIGVQILKHLEPLSYVLPGVLHHHEMINGRGYPHGLSGDTIPLSGRIIAVADAYDAMTSDRPYRKGMPTEKSEGILRGGAGIQWDARVVDAFVAVLPDVYAICGTGGAAPPDRRVMTTTGETVMWPRFESIAANTVSG